MLRCRLFSCDINKSLDYLGNADCAETMFHKTCNDKSEINTEGGGYCSYGGSVDKWVRFGDQRFEKIDYPVQVSCHRVFMAMNVSASTGSAPAALTQRTPA